MSKKENVTGQLGWQDKTQTHCKNGRFFRPGITREIFTILKLIWKITFEFVGKNLGPTLNFTPKVFTKNLGTVQNSTPKYVACPEYVIYWKNTPGDIEIQVFLFDYR